MSGARNVYELAQSRLERIFSSFDNVYVSFSGGKDSGVLLNLCIDYIRRNGLTCKLGVFHMDYEVQYRETLRYLDEAMASNADLLEVYRVCVPFRVPTCTSMFQPYWRPWEESKRSQWVREMPPNAYTCDDFPFFADSLWDYEFQARFAEWLHLRKGAKRTCCLVGIRTQESLNRWRSIYSEKNYRRFEGLKWVREAGPGLCNAYPIYDWRTTDVWTANGKFGWSYNRLYDLYHRAGVPLEIQRVTSPFITQAQASLKLYRAIDPDMWGKMVNRVNGVNFTAIYGGSSAVGWYTVKLPPGFTWSRYMRFLLDTLPVGVRNNYLRKFEVSARFWRERGGCLSDATIRRLQEAGVPVIVGEKSGYRTDKKPVRMEYMDDIDIPESRELPTYKRVCICILKNDHLCKYMGFAPTKRERERKKQLLEKCSLLTR